MESGGGIAADHQVGSINGARGQNSVDGGGTREQRPAMDGENLGGRSGPDAETVGRINDRVQYASRGIDINDVSILPGYGPQSKSRGSSRNRFH